VCGSISARCCFMRFLGFRAVAERALARAGASEIGETFAPRC
jgi:hypothetical protein